MHSPLHYKRKLFYFLGFSLRYIKKFGFVNAYPVWSYLHHSGTLPGELLKVNLQGDNGTIWLRHLSPDIGTFEHVFVWEGYNVELPVSPMTILDLGGNIGLASRWYANKYPEAHIFVVEPDLENFKILKINCLDSGKFHCIRAAVGPRDGFGTCDNPEALSHSFRFSTSEQCTDLPVKSIKTLLRDSGLHGFDLVKMDVEGAEEQLFADVDSLSEWLPNTRALAVEIHTDRARQLIHDAMSSSEWTHSHYGETDFFVRRVE